MVARLAPHRLRIVAALIATAALLFWLPLVSPPARFYVFHDFNPQQWSEWAHDPTAGADGGCCYQP